MSTKRPCHRYSDNVFYSVMDLMREGKFNKEIIAIYPELSAAIVSSWRRKYSHLPANGLPDFHARYLHGRSSTKQPKEISL